LKESKLKQILSSEFIQSFSNGKFKLLSEKEVKKRIKLILEARKIKSK
jgi:hypothetical protein